MCIKGGKKRYYSLLKWKKRVSYCIISENITNNSRVIPFRLVVESGSGSRLGLCEGLLATCMDCTKSIPKRKHETFFYFSERASLVFLNQNTQLLLKIVQHIICSIKNQIVLLAIVSICTYSQAKKNLDLPK
jgi:hypothetical protein